MTGLPGSRPLRKATRAFRVQATLLYRYTLGYTALFCVVAAGVVATVPELRERAGVVHTAVLSALGQGPAPETALAGMNLDLGQVLSEARPVTLAHNEGARVRALHQYIGNRYKVPVSAAEALVQTAWDVGNNTKLDPLLLLAVIGIESSFNPFAESGAGAQGLMQVLTRVHRDKFERFGGTHAAWQPEANIEVGAQILKDCIARRGSISGGLTCYVGSPGTASAYGRKVLAERERLRQVLGDTPPLAMSAPQIAG